MFSVQPSLKWKTKKKNKKLKDSLGGSLSLFRIFLIAFSIGLGLGLPAVQIPPILEADDTIDMHHHRSAGYHSYPWQQVYRENC